MSSPIEKETIDRLGKEFELPFDVSSTSSAEHDLSATHSHCLDDAKKYLLEKQSKFFGYQCNQALDYQKYVGEMLNYQVNNIGDPYQEGGFRLSGKFAERAVIRYMSQVWRCPIPARLGPTPSGSPRGVEELKNYYNEAFGYILSMGCTEGNLYALRNARDYLKGKFMTPLLYGNHQVHAAKAKRMKQSNQDDRDQSKLSKLSKKEKSLEKDTKKNKKTELDGRVKRNIENEAVNVDESHISSCSNPSAPHPPGVSCVSDDTIESFVAQTKADHAKKRENDEGVESALPSNLELTRKHSLAVFSPSDLINATYLPKETTEKIVKSSELEKGGSATVSTATGTEKPAKKGKKVENQENISTSATGINDRSDGSDGSLGDGNPPSPGKYTNSSKKDTFVLAHGVPEFHTQALTKEHKKTLHLRRRQPVILYSTASHYSIDKIKDLLEIHTPETLGNLHYPGQCPITQHLKGPLKGIWPPRIPAHINGMTNIPALVQVAKFFTSRGFPIIVSTNYGTTFTGVHDNVAKIHEALKAAGCLREDEWKVHRDIPLGMTNDSKGGATGATAVTTTTTDSGMLLPEERVSRRNYWLHVDAALGGFYGSFFNEREPEVLQRAADVLGIPLEQVPRLPAFDFGRAGPSQSQSQSQLPGTKTASISTSTSTSTSDMSDSVTSSTVTDTDSNKNAGAVGTMSIAMSGHKVMGAPFPCGIVMTQRKYMLDFSSIEYIGSADTTLAGSRNGLSSFIMWSYLARHSPAHAIRKYYNLLQLAKKTAEILSKTLGCGINEEAGLVFHFENSLSVILPRPSQSLIDQYSLSCDDIVFDEPDTKQFKRLQGAHIYLMDHIKLETIQGFAEKLKTDPLAIKAMEDYKERCKNGQVHPLVIPKELDSSWNELQTFLNAKKKDSSSEHQHHQHHQHQHQHHHQAQPTVPVKLPGTATLESLQKDDMKAEK